MKKSSIIPKRYFMVAGTFLLALLLYIDRICISVAKDPISEALSLTDKQMGWIMSSFALGYALFQTPAGMLSDRLGPRKILTSIVAIWSVFTALTGAVWSFISLLVIRFLFGVGEAGAFPGMSRAIYSWIPLQERGLVTGINFSGSRLGAAFTLPMVVWLIDSYGWRVSFMILGVIGVVWSVLWYAYFRDTPETHSGISEEEKEYILATRQQKVVVDKVEKLNFFELIKSKNMQLAMVQYFASNFTFFFALTWLFPYIKDTYQLETIEAGFYTGIPLIFGAIGNWFSGYLSDVIYKKGKWTQSRILPATLGFSLAAIGLVGSVFMSDINGAIFFLSLAIFGADMTLPPSWSFCVDIGKEHSGAVSGTMNMAGNIGSFITALVFPYLLAWTNSTTLFFIIGALLNIVAIIAWNNMRPQKHFKQY